MIWIVGDKGMLGSELRHEFERTGMAFIGSDLEVDFLDVPAIEDFANSNNVTTIVNCAAYTAVDKADDEPELCAKLNIQGPENLAKLAKRRGVKLIHISTDYVFGGDATRPYREDDPVKPTGEYGRTKAEGERALFAAFPEAVVLRTAWLYGEFGNNFVYTMLKLMREKDEIGVVADQRGTPTWANDLARCIIAVFKDRKGNSGIYHFTDEGETNWYDFAVKISEIGQKLGVLERNCKILPLTTEQYPTRAQRPKYSVLSKEKIYRDFGVTVPAWSKSLETFLEKIAAADSLPRE